MNTKTQHTPGPWEVKSIGHYYSVKGTKTPHKNQICKVSPGICACAAGQQHGAANARLIAAAPDLLDHLKLARLWLDELCGLIQSGAFDAAEDWVGANAVSTDSTLAEVIAKAEGN